MSNASGSSVAESVDALVVGSGFGASVAAFRLAQAGKSVIVMERGRSYGPGDFARSPSEMTRNFWDPSERLYGLFDAWTFRGLEGIVSSGLGGGSLIYANVLLRKDENWFVRDSPLPGGGYENWPFSRDDLDPHYDAVEKMMQVATYPYDDTPKTQAFHRASVRLGMPAVRPPLAVTFARAGDAAAPNMPLDEAPYGNVHGARRVTCTLCGECDMGCNSGAKNSLDHTYLSAAAHEGADIRTLHEVRGIRPLDGRDGGYDVRYVVHDPDATGVGRTRALPVRHVRARRVILGAGTFGTSHLLLSNRTSLRGLGPALGTRFSGNGDLLTMLMNCTTGDGAPLRIDGQRGPVITSAIRVPDALDGGTGRGFYVEDAGFPAFLTWLVEMAQLRAMGRRAAGFGWRALRNRLFAEGRSNISGDLASLLGDAHLSGSTLPLLGMGRDTPDGRLSLRRGRLAVDWTKATSREYFARVRGVMEDLARELGADFRDNPLWWVGRVVTVHPLGGAPAGRHPGDGVVDTWGEVFGHPGLHVLDGAALPGPVGANPSLTIAAFSDRASTHMLEQRWSTPRGGSTRAQTERRDAMASTPTPTPTPAPPPSAGASVSFTETMRGTVALGQTDPAAGAALGRMHRDDLVFQLTITAPDIDAFRADARHEARATGWVESDLLGGRAEVERGWFNLFVRAADARRRRMLYRLWLTDPGGTPITLVGYKDIGDDPGFDLWSDTTTLYVQLLVGHVPPPNDPTDDPFAHTDAISGAPTAAVIAAGKMIIAPLDFARQLTTFRSDGPHTATQKAAAISAFGGLFLGELWQVYLAREPATSSVEASAP